MDVHEAIRERRSIARFHPEPVPTDLLRHLLEAGTWAPNHHLTEPWRFIVVGPDTRRLLAERYGKLRAARIPGDASERAERVHLESVAKFMAVPTVVVVAVDQIGDPQRRLEDYAAACCAIQNIQLAAWAEGVGMKWSTSALIHDTETYGLLSLDVEQAQIVGLLYAGYPAEVPARPRRKTLDEVIRWAP